MADRPKILILGGGFGGVGAVKKLKHADADVVLVDRHDYHTFQPLLYQVATDLLELPTVGHPLRDLFHDHENVRIHEATATGIDLDARTVSFEGIESLTYDHLVLALGATVNFFGVPGADEHAFPLYTLPDAVRLKNHVLEKWKAADRDPSLVDDGALNVVIVGGGPTGVESAGALAELYRTNLAKDYPDVPQDKARLILVEASDSLLSMFKKGLRTYTKKALEKRTVEVMLGEVVEKIEPTRVHLKSGTVIDAHTLVWGAGLQANPLATTLGLDLQHGNRVAAAPDLSLPDRPEVFVAGDIGWITDTKTKEVLPQLGSVALQAGEHAGENIARRLKGKDTKPFKYLDKGTMATIGRKAAVVQMPHGRSLTGRTAWLAWGAVHLALLSTGEDRARAVVDWTWAGFTHDRAGRIVVDESGD
ncbi:MAG TPA: NAD(P)/FAD-dependent oxidoreductase [Actinomycetota bacterium]|jgi:NADH:ubiquinone reductase (H+-translocating)|nr:NAD(P)/FAD-dependent oxidoreductase [Actinomycetota bacterium]